MRKIRHSFVKNLANGWERGSFAAKLRQRRFDLFLSILEQFPEPIDILDIGGQENFWKVVGTDHKKIQSVTLLNLWKEPTSLPKLKSIVGDARDLHALGNKSVEMIFSNSVIEHVGGFREQQRMAQEIQRVGKNFFIQTPNRYFPLEPHFLFPFFQFLPDNIRAYFHSKWNLGWWERNSNYFEALAEVESIRLLTKKELQFLFKNSQIYKEKIFGWTKSIVVYKKLKIDAK